MLSVAGVLLVLLAGPTLTLSPKKGPVGTTFTATGTGFVPGEQIKTYWDGAKLKGTFRVEADGTFEFPLQIPNGTSFGPHSLVVESVGASGNRAQATFTVIDPTTTTTSTTSPSTTSTTTANPTTTTTVAAGPAPKTTTATTSPSNTTSPTVTATTQAGVMAPVSDQNLDQGAWPGIAQAGTLGETTNTTLEGSDSGTPTAVAAAQGNGPDRQAATNGSDGSGGIGTLIAALLAIGAVGAFTFRYWVKSHAKPANPVLAPVPSDDDEEIHESMILAADVEGHAGNWAREMVDLSPPGELTAVVTTASGPVALGWVKTAGGRGQALAWKSQDGMHWEAVSALGVGGALLAIPWRQGVLLAATQESERRFETSCWWSSDGLEWEALGDGDESLSGVSLEGGTARGGVVVAWGRNADGPGVWHSSDGAHWQQCDLTGPVDLIESVGPAMIAFGHEPDGRRSFIAWSGDGVSWKEAPVEASRMFDGSSVATLMKLDGGVVVGGTDVMRGKAAIWVSDDARRWLRTPFEPETGTSIEHLAEVDGRFVAVGADVGSGRRGRGTVAVWVSDDAVSWERVEAGDLFANAIASAIAPMGESARVYGTMYVDTGEPVQEPVPVIWSGSIDPIEEQAVPVGATQESG